MTLEGNTLLQLQKWWDAICSAVCKSLSTNKNWPPYRKLNAENNEITNFLLPPDTLYKNITPKENFESFSREFRVHLVKDTTI